MDGKQAIIDRIISDAEDRAKIIAKCSDEKCKQESDEAAKWAADYQLKRDEELKAECESIISIRKTLADLDVKKITLAAKRNVIDEIFSAVTEKLCALDKQKYTAFVNDLLLKYATNGDKVVLASSAPISYEDLKELPVFTEKKLIADKKRGDFSGGVYLSNAICDTDLSFSALVRNSREEYESEIAADVFGGEKA